LRPLIALCVETVKSASLFGRFRGAILIDLTLLNYLLLNAFSPSLIGCRELAFGAILGSICADIMIALGWISAEHYTLIVILGITSFLSSTSRIPITACVFAIEALGGINNILAIIIAATASLLIVELSGLEDFTDTLINAKVRAIKKGKTPTVVEVRLTVKESSFAVGKEIHDILWPNACTVISFERSAQNKGNIGISAGDVITVHYKTYNPAVTAEEITSLVGIQNDNIFAITNPSDQ
jgi:hypothetical protein